MKMSQFMYITGLFYREWRKFDEFDGIFSWPEVISRVTKRSLSQATPVPDGKAAGCTPGKTATAKQARPSGKRHDRRAAEPADGERAPYMTGRAGKAREGQNTV